MRFLAQPALRTARLLLPAVAFLTLAGTSAAVAAPLPGGAQPAQVHSVAAKPAKFTWHPFKLLNGWKSASKKLLLTGTPAWAYRDGVVYLRGAIRQPTPGGSSTFARLPKYARSAHNLYLQVSTSEDVVGDLRIGLNGSLEAYGGNAVIFTSLGAVSYPTAAVKSHQVTLKNTWVSSQPSYQSGNPAYAISKGVVYLSGSMHSVTDPPPSTLTFILPKAARPAHELVITMYTFGGDIPGVMIIEPQGEVDVAGAEAVGYISLAGISFPVAGTKWHNFKLNSGWKSDASKFGPAAPAYAVVNGVVYLNGSMNQSPAGDGLWTFLPAAARTADIVDIEVNTAGDTDGVLTMTPHQGLVGSVPFGNAEMSTSLSGIAYPPSS
jgi:hypothetical protein